MTRYKIYFKDGGTEVHFGGVSQKDVSLCLHDLSGDDCFGRSYAAASVTKDKVDCKDCIAIVNYCKSINENEYK